MVVAGIVLLAIVYLALAIPTALHGPYNPDEGWYLYDSWLTWSGHLPYRDFGFPQPPLTLFIHGFFQIFLGPGFYIGRIVSVVIGLLALLVTSITAYRIGGQQAGLAAGALLAVSPWFILNMGSVSTYAPASLILALILLAAYSRKWWALGALLVLLILTRLPLLVFFPIMTGYVLVATRHNRWTSLRNFMLGAVGAGILILGPFIALAPQQTASNIIDYHLITRQSLTQTIIESPEYFWWSIKNFMKTEYFPIYGMWWAIAVGSLIICYLLDNRRKFLFLSCVILATLAVAVSQVFAMSPTYDLPLLIPLAIVGGQGIGRILQVSKKFVVRAAVATAYAALLLTGIVSPQLPVFEGFGNNEESHQNIKRVVRYVQEHTQPDDFIFTPELYIALEANRHSLPGTEMGRFFYFPSMSNDESRQLGVLNQQQFKQIIATRQARLIIFNRNHHWQNYPEDPQLQLTIDNLLASSGYHLVKELSEYKPQIQQLVVYDLQ